MSLLLKGGPKDSGAQKPQQKTRIGIKTREVGVLRNHVPRVGTREVDVLRSHVLGVIRATGTNNSNLYMAQPTGTSNSSL